MGQDTKIAWTDHTMNPWLGCAKVSAGCKFCYAEQFITKRMGKPLWGPGAKRERTKSPWKNARKWNRQALALGQSQRVFCGSLCDIFEDHPTANEIRPDVWELIRECTALDWQLLTKRPENIRRFLPDDWGNGWPHVWLGCTIEDNRVAYRGDLLHHIPAAVRFISYEPAIGPLDLLSPLAWLDWVIYGGESGPGHRTEDKQWARDMRDRCKLNGVAFFHKQSAGYRAGLGVELDGELIREFPSPRRVLA